jgi:hypothetical protein
MKILLLVGSKVFPTYATRLNCSNRMDLDGQTLRLPVDQQFYPSREHLRWHHAQVSRTYMMTGGIWWPWKPRHCGGRSACQEQAGLRYFAVLLKLPHYRCVVDSRWTESAPISPIPAAGPAAPTCLFACTCMTSLSWPPAARIVPQLAE